MNWAMENIYDLDMQFTNVSTLTLTFKQETWFEATAHPSRHSVGEIWPDLAQKII